MNKAVCVYFPPESLAIHRPGYDRFVFHLGSSDGDVTTWNALCGRPILRDGGWQMVRVRRDTAEEIAWVCGACAKMEGQS